MNLTQAAVYQLEIPLTGAFTSSHGAKSTVPTTLAVVTDESGTIGIGTSDPSAASKYYSDTADTFADLQHSVLPKILETQPKSPNELTEVLNQHASVREAYLAAEMAYLDVFGKRTGQSISDILGGRLRDVEELNGWVGVGTPEEMVAEAIEFRDIGFTGLKMKLEGEVAPDLERLQAVCSAVGSDMQVRVDANTAYSVEAAIEVAKAMESLPITHFEQPIAGEDIDGLQQITESTSTTIMADEAVRTFDELLTVLNRGAADRVKLKIMRLGGIRKADFAIKVADLYGISCVVGHGYCSLPGQSAEVQVTTANSNVFQPVETVGSHKIDEEPFETVHNVGDHSMTLVDAPGLGVELREDLLDDFVEEAAGIDRA